MTALEIAVKMHDSVIHSCIFNVNYVKTFDTVLVSYRDNIRYFFCNSNSFIIKEKIPHWIKPKAVSPNSDLFDVHSHWSFCYLQLDLSDKILKVIITFFSCKFSLILYHINIFGFLKSNIAEERSSVSADVSF